MKQTANKPPMPSPEFQKVIQDCRAELRNAERENIEGNLQKVEQHLFNAKKILQNVLPPTEDDEPQTLALLQGIRNGSIDPKSLRPDERRRLVSLLAAEGQSTAEIAQLLKTSGRTIERDRFLCRGRYGRQ